MVPLNFPQNLATNQSSETDMTRTRTMRKKELSVSLLDCFMLNQWTRLKHESGRKDEPALLAWSDAATFDFESFRGRFSKDLARNLSTCERRGRLVYESGRGWFQAPSAHGPFHQNLRHFGLRSSESSKHKISKAWFG